MMKKVLLVLMVLILAGCITETDLMIEQDHGEENLVVDSVGETVTPTVFEMELIRKTPTITATSETLCSLYEPCSCSKEIPEEVRTGHILYLTEDVITNEFWFISMADGTTQKIMETDSIIIGSYLFDDGESFILASLYGKIWLGNLADGSIELVEASDELIDPLPHNSELWVAMNIDDPDVHYRWMGEFYSPDWTRLATYQLGAPSFDMVDLTTGERVPIIETYVTDRGIAEDIDAEWSENSETLYFSRSWLEPSDSNTYTQLYQVDRDGNNLQPLIDPILDGFILMGDLSPDQTKIAFTIELPGDMNNNERIGIYDLETNEMRTFLTGNSLRPKMDGMFTWSPDGRYIAYITDWGQLDIEVMVIETGATYCITDDERLEMDLHWK